MTTATLDAFLGSYAESGDALRAAVSSVVRHLSLTSVKIRNTINQGALGKAFASRHGGKNADGDVQKDLDVFADDMFLDAMRQAPVALYASEELEHPALLDASAPLALAIDPLDGSSNIDTNVSIGTIFSILPVAGRRTGEPGASLFSDGATPARCRLLHLRAATGAGADARQRHACLRVLGAARRIRPGLCEPAIIADRAHEFAINAANYRHWDEAVRLYVDDCLKGSEGPRERDFNMRWIASLVAEAYRILIRGGVFLYPGRQTQGLRARAGSAWSTRPIPSPFSSSRRAARRPTRSSRILDLDPKSLHQRVPLVFGSAREVARIGRYHTEPSNIGERAPLFGNRGLFRA